MDQRSVHPFLLDDGSGEYPSMWLSDAESLKEVNKPPRRLSAKRQPKLLVSTTVLAPHDRPNTSVGFVAPIWPPAPISMTRIGGVTGPYATVITVVALLFAASTLVLAAANRHPGVPLLVAGGLLEALLVVFAVGGVVQMIGSRHDFARVEFVGYLLGCVAIPPIAFVWAWGERSRAGAFVIALAFLITPIMILRVQQVWAGPLV